MFSALVPQPLLLSDPASLSILVLLLRKLEQPSCTFFFNPFLRLPRATPFRDETAMLLSLLNSLAASGKCSYSPPPKVASR